MLYGLTVLVMHAIVTIYYYWFKMYYFFFLLQFDQSVQSFGDSILPVLCLHEGIDFSCWWESHRIHYTFVQKDRQLLERLENWDTWTERALSHYL